MTCFRVAAGRGGNAALPETARQRSSHRGTGYKFCCGLGVRAVRAGSIGRDTPRFGKRIGPPRGKAGGLGPRPRRGEITAS